jgi:flagellin-like hook-associated protein FlgL
VPESFHEITHDLQVLKESLIAMGAADISAADRAAVAQEISAIRLQLKRLLADQKTLGAEIERRALGG